MHIYIYICCHASSGTKWVGRVRASENWNFSSDPISPLRFECIFQNCQKRRRRSGTHRKLITDPVSGLFFLPETRSTARGWRGPQVNLFPPFVSGPFYAILLRIPNTYFFSGFDRITHSDPELGKKHPRTNLRRSWKKTPLFSVKIFGKKPHKLIRDPWPFFLTPSLPGHESANHWKPLFL